LNDEREKENNLPRLGRGKKVRNHFEEGEKERLLLFSSDAN
jgi:hypothetical protein